MKTILTALVALAIAASAQDTGLKNTRPDESAGKQSEAKLDGEQKEAATVLHRDEVLHDRGGGKHLWPLLNTREATAYSGPEFNLPGD